MKYAWIFYASLLGCATDLETSDLDQASEISNGVSLNGVSLNGVSLNGVSLNGVSLNGVSLNGVSLNGVSLDGTTIAGVRADGQVVSYAAVGSTFRAELSDGSTIPLRIDSATQLVGANADLWAYSVTYQLGASRYALCGDPAVLALAVRGTWDLNFGTATGGRYNETDGRFTFACRGNTVAKCVELGYKPALGLAPQLASCVRLLRGDYCGNGTAYTRTGHTVNLYDNVGVQRDTELWTLEAEWSPEGARCLSVPLLSRFYENGYLPSCVASGALRIDASCGTRFSSGSKLISELPLAPTATVQGTLSTLDTLTR
jgi:ADYC domain/Pentapeptide repeats (8 copies)